MIWCVLRIIILRTGWVDLRRDYLRSCCYRLMGGQQLGDWRREEWSETNFRGKIENEHEGCVGVDLEYAINYTLQFYMPHHINHFIFLCKLCICLSFFSSDLHELWCFHSSGVRYNISPRLGSLPHGFIAQWTHFCLHAPTLLPLLSQLDIPEYLSIF